MTVDQPNTSADGSNTTPSKNVTLSQGGSTTDGDEDYSGEEYDVLITDGDSSEHQQPQKTDEHKENQVKENEKKIQ